MQNATIRSIVDDRTATIAGGRRLHTWNDLLGAFPGVIGVKTGHTDAAGWSQVAAARGTGFVLYATLLGSPTRAQRNTDLAALLRWGPFALRTGRRRRRDAHVRARRRRLWAEPVALVAPRSIIRSTASTARSASGSSPRLRSSSRCAEAAPGRGAHLRRSEARGELALVAERAVAEPGLAKRASWYAQRTVSNLWP
jgi:D-alanyl-D-alanine carboxypeptidase